MPLTLEMAAVLDSQRVASGDVGRKDMLVLRIRTEEKSRKVLQEEK